MFNLPAGIADGSCGILEDFNYRFVAPMEWSLSWQRGALPSASRFLDALTAPTERQGFGLPALIAPAGWSTAINA